MKREKEPLQQCFFFFVICVLSLERSLQLLSKSANAVEKEVSQVMTFSKLNEGLFLDRLQHCSVFQNDELHMMAVIFF